MRPELLRLFRMGQLFGFSPYTIDPDTETLSFEWCTRQTLYFFTIMYMGFLNLVYVVYGFFVTWVEVS